MKYTRSHLRFATKFQAEILSRNFCFREKVIAENLSLGGIFLKTDNYTLDNDEPVCLEVMCPNKPKIRVIGKIRWSKTLKKDNSESVGRGLGIQFQGGQSSDIMALIQNATTYQMDAEECMV